MSISETRQRAARRETSAAKNIPYQGHLTPSIIDTNTGECMCVLRVAGAAFECADDDVINNRHDRLNRVVMSLADPRVAVWQHIVRREEKQYPDGDFPPGYARELNERYKTKVSIERLMVNELYISVVLRPYSNRTEKVLASLFASRSPEEIEKARQNQVEELDQIVTDLIAAMATTRPIGWSSMNTTACYFASPPNSSTTWSLAGGSACLMHPSRSNT
jgi:type IV secretion system protein VirB4